MMRLSKTRSARSAEQGYIMLTLLLMIALMIIAAAIIVPSISFDIKRDREEEMIHRGVQYSRAIRAYYKKFGRYPAKLEDLENTNQLRFLRKRYKDPITGKDFRILHYGEAKLALNALSGGAVASGAAGGSQFGPNGSTASGAGLSQPSSFGGSSAFGSSNSSGFSSNSNSTFGSTSQGATPASTDASQNGSGGQSAPNPDGSSSGDKLSNTQFGGAPIVGVASTSKDPTIREFDHKKKYNEWQFVYDPTLDRGMLITTPYQQQMQGFGMQQTPNLNGQNGSSSGSSFGNSNSSSFGNSPGGMQPSSPGPGSFGGSTTPANPPQQQQ